MFQICRYRNIMRNVFSRNIRKYSENKGPFYDCPHQREQVMEARRRDENRTPVHPFLVKRDHSKKMLFYRRLFYFVCIPSLLIGFVNAFYITPEPKRPPFAPYSYLRIRVKDFPWGDGKKTLFHNSHLNALPEGYETDEDED